MSTVKEIVNKTRSYLLSGHREELNKLNGALTSGATTLIAEYDLGGIKSKAELGVDLELFHVWSVEEATKTATVERAQGGSAAAAHDDNSIIEVNPKFSRFSIFQAINDELADLSSPVNGLFQVKTLDIDYNVARSGYDLTSVTDLLAIQGVFYEELGGTNHWHPVDSALVRSLPTTEFASGFGLMLHEWAAPGRDLRVQYRAPYTLLTAANYTADAELTATTGLHVQAHDILALGAAARLMAPREIKRNFTETQGDTRRPDEVPPGAVLNSYRGIIAERQRRIYAEAARLQAAWPVTM